MTSGGDESLASLLEGMGPSEVKTDVGEEIKVKAAPRARRAAPALMYGCLAMLAVLGIAFVGLHFMR